MRNFIVVLLTLFLVPESAIWLYRGLHQGGWMPGARNLLNLVLLARLLSYHNQLVAMLRALAPIMIRQANPAANMSRTVAG